MNERILNVKQILTDKQMQFLDILLIHNELCGVEIVEKSNGKLGRGATFAIATNFEELGIIESFVEKVAQKRIPRRFYSVTEKGKRFYDTVKELDQKTDRELCPVFEGA